MDGKRLLSDEELELATGGTIRETMDNYRTFKSWKLLSGEEGFSPRMLEKHLQAMV